jgi:hypothetical protein
VDDAVDVLTGGWLLDELDVDGVVVDAVVAVVVDRRLVNRLSLTPTGFVDDVVAVDSGCDGAVVDADERLFDGSFALLLLFPLPLLFSIRFALNLMFSLY